MNFDLSKNYTFARALKPPEIMTKTKNWSTVHGYVYVISKTMPTVDGGPSLNCVKVGFSNVKTKDMYDKGYSRLLSFRTSLITFKVHRIYLFEASDFDAGSKEAFGLNAFKAEQAMHYYIDREFKPSQVHLTFSNGKNTEWWNIFPKQMNKFLAFCDLTVQQNSPIPPVYGTDFGKTSTKRIEFMPRVSMTGVRSDKNGVLYQSSTGRKLITNIHEAYIIVKHWKS